MTKEKTTSEIVKTFAVDTIYAGFLFLIVYLVTVGISEFMYACNDICKSFSREQKIVFYSIKWVMIVADFIMMIAFIYKHTCTALSELNFEIILCKGKLQ